MVHAPGQFVIPNYKWVLVSIHSAWQLYFWAVVHSAIHSVLSSSGANLSNYKIQTDKLFWRNRLKGKNGFNNVKKKQTRKRIHAPISFYSHSVSMFSNWTGCLHHCATILNWISILLWFAWLFGIFITIAGHIVLK